MVAALLASVLVVVGSSDARCHDDAGMQPRVAIDSVDPPDVIGKVTFAVEPEVDRPEDERLETFAWAPVLLRVERVRVLPAPTLSHGRPPSSAARVTPRASRAPPA
jgi:hypothetical protein